jgi:hypothetical protein
MIEKKITLLQKIQPFINQFYENQEKNKCALTKLLTTYLKHNPYDTEIWIKFALIIHCLFKDNNYAIECLKTILMYQSNNIPVTMFLVFLTEHVSTIDDQLFEQLCSLQSSNKEILSLIEYQKAWYYLNKNEALYQYTLESSIELCDKFVWNQRALGCFYFLQKEIEMGRSFFKKAINNIHHIYSYDEYQYVGISNINDFFNARLKGTHIMQPMVLMMIKVLEAGNNYN